MMAKPAKRYTFKVAGTGEFPADMLRYDQCEPLTDVDRRLVEARYSDDRKTSVLRDENGRLRVNTVQLVTSRGDLVKRGIIPTEARWRSFLWRVIGEPQEVT